jgi:predicted Rossmann-fold nucleotide-binding protein
MRNARMLTYKPDLVIAFPGGRGTEDMISQARTAGVTVTKVPAF